MIAELNIQTAVRADKTVLKNCFYTQPFKVLDITEDTRKPMLHLMLMNASPGVLDGDYYNMQFDIGAGSLVRLHTQSYQRLFQMKTKASQTFAINLSGGSSFCYVPHPTVPHASSNFTSKTKIRLSDNCTLIYGDVLTCGRNGEQFCFSKYHSITEIFLNGKLAVKENLLVQPALVDMTMLGLLETYTHQASLIYLNETARIGEVMNNVHDLLLSENDLCFGVSILPVTGFMVRLLGYKGEQLYGLLKKIAAGLMDESTTQQPKANSKQNSYAY